jgi:hypothetical protein
VKLTRTAVIIAATVSIVTLATAVKADPTFGPPFVPMPENPVVIEPGPVQPKNVPDATGTAGLLGMSFLTLLAFRRKPVTT